MKLTKNDPDKYKYSDYGIGFDSRLEFSSSVGSVEKILLFLDLIIVPLCILMVEIKMF